MNQRHINKIFRAISMKEGLLPVKVTPFYEKKIKEEVGAMRDFG